jgi:putative transposase
VRTIVDAPDAHEVDAQLHRVIEALVGKLPEAADHLEQAREDLLALAALPLASSGARS